MQPAGQSSRADAAEVLFVGTRGGLEERLLKNERLAYAAVDSRPMSRASVGAAAGGAAANVRGMAQALPLLKRFKPDVVIATGGYASVPTVFAAAMLRSTGSARGLKIALLEPNVAPGRANRVLAKLADEVWGAYDATAAFFPGKFVKTGIPVRPELYRLPSRDAASKRLGIDPAARTILVFGGSQGARAINVAASSMTARRRLPKDWQILHAAGKRDFEWMAAERKAESNPNRYVLVEYLEDMAAAYAAADVAVCRSGASTLAELAVVGLPAVLIPYPHATDDHQRVNADVFAAAGAAIALDNAKLDADSLYWTLNEVLAPQRLAAMRSAALSLAQPRALHAIVERILSHQIGASSSVETAAGRSAQRRGRDKRRT